MKSDRNLKTSGQSRHRRDNKVLIRSGEARLVGWSRNMLHSGFNTLPRSVFWSADFNGRSDNTDVIQTTFTTGIFCRSLHMGIILKFCLWILRAWMILVAASFIVFVYLLFFANPEAFGPDSLTSKSPLSSRLMLLGFVVFLFIFGYALHQTFQRELRSTK